ncbi:NACHT and WD repeat domain-containing protein [Candidatus Leptofilum sp.]|uniref:NACHT and WD repeat domain-containing protein n=1 Tax=Candidatus Leptofilum sp. TaxID=3241576 RepID=UPI003B59A90A
MSETEQTSGDHIEIGDIKNGKAIAIGRGATAVYQGLTVEEVAALVVELKNKDQPTVWNGRIPYLGLSAYQEADARYFFGRESLVAELLQRVQEASFITIAGPSGSGKSSVARAGLFHALRQGEAIENSDRWLLATMQPKGDPFGQLATAMEKATKATAVGDALQPKDDEYPTAETLLRQVAMYLEDGNGRCLLLVDQFEELFTQTKSTEQRQAFIDLLTHASQAPESPLTIIISLRSDFVSNCAGHEKLRALMSQQFQLVGAMAPRDLTKAITLPALQVGADIDDKLVSRIIADMKGSPDALPLMSFALRDLFEVEKTKKGEPMDLTLPEYVQRGGLEKALEEHANKVFDNFTDDQKEIAKNIFSKLIEVGQGRVDTRRTATFAELIPAGSSAEVVTQVLANLADMRLVTTSDLAVVEGEAVTTSDQDSTVTIAHEKMIDAWPWLRALVDENRDLIALQNQINNDAQAWAKDHDAGFLYRGRRLLQIEEKLEIIKSSLGSISVEFVQTSLDHREQEQQKAQASRKREEDLKSQKRIGRILGWAIVISGILLIISVNSTFQAVRTQAEIRQLKEVVQSNQLAELARVEARNDPIKALLIAVAGFRLNRQPNTHYSIAITLQTPFPTYPTTILYSHEGMVNSATFSLDGEQFVTASDDGTARVWDTEGNELAVLRGHEGAVSSAEFSSNGEQIVTASGDGTAQVWDAAGNELAILNGHTDWVWSATFSPDGERIVTASEDGTARVWDVTGNELAILDRHTDWVWSATFSSDGERIVTASIDGTARVWDVTGNELAVLNGHTDAVRLAIFSPDGERIVTTSIDGTARVWDTSGSELAVLSGHADWIWSATFSPDGERIVTTNLNNGTVLVWDVAGDELAILDGHTDWVWSATFSSDGERIVTASIDGTARVWDVTGNELAVLNGHKDAVWSATFNPDGERIVTTGADETVRVWPGYSVKYIVNESYRRIQRDFTDEECQQYFRDDLDACPRSKRELFEPLFEYLTLEQQADWQSLEE